MNFEFSPMVISFSLYKMSRFPLPFHTHSSLVAGEFSESWHHLHLAGSLWVIDGIQSLTPGCVEMGMFQNLSCL